MFIWQLFGLKTVAHAKQRKHRRPSSAPMKKQEQLDEENIEPFGGKQLHVPSTEARKPFNKTDSNKHSENEMFIYQDTIPQSESSLSCDTSRSDHKSSSLSGKSSSTSTRSGSRPGSAKNQNRHKRALRTIHKNSVHHFMRPTLANYLENQNCVQVMHLHV